MKKKIIWILMLFILPTFVLAAKSGVSVGFEGVITANPGDTVAYDIKVTTDELKPSKLKAELNYDNEVLELKNIATKADGWDAISGSKDIEFLNKKGGSTGTFVIATVTFKVKDNVPKQNTEIKLSNIQLTTLDEDNGESISNVSDRKVTLSIKSVDNSLKDLKVDGMSLEDFKKDVYEYELEVDSETDTLEITPILNNANATFVDSFGVRVANIDYGENEIIIKVKSESGDIRVYKINVFREDNRNTNNNLKEVIINSGKIKLELSKNKVDYVIKTYKLNKIEVDAVAVDSKAKVDVKIPNEVIVGENVVVITVTSENNEEKVYTITFENSDTTIDTKIKTLHIKGYELDFDKNTMVYEVVYNKNLKNGLNISVVPVSGKDLVEYIIYYNGKELKDDNVSLKVGDKYEIKVIPIGLEEGVESDSSTYTITIIKDTRISFFLVLEIFIIAVLLILILIQLIKRTKIKKNKQAKEEKINKDQVKKEMDKTKVISDDELEKINNNNKE